MLLYVSATILKVIERTVFTCKAQTSAKPIKLDVELPIAWDNTPKYPAEAIVTREHKSVIKFIHRLAVFWFDKDTM